MPFYNDGNYSNKTLDGTCQHLSMYTNKAFREYVPFHNYDYTYLKITNDHHDINLINKNFINVTAQIKISPKTDHTFETRGYKYGRTLADIIADEANSIDPTFGVNGVVDGEADAMMYIGWKNSGEIIEEMMVYNNNRETGFQQIHADRENYLESTKFKTKTEKDLYRDCHFAYENYKNLNKGEVPGLITSVYRIKGTEYDNIVVNNARLIGRPHSNRVFALTQAFVDKCNADRIGLLTLNNWTDIGADALNVIIDLTTLGTPDCIEWTDFCFEYDYVMSGARYQTEDGTPYATIQLLAGAIQASPALKPKINDPYYRVQYVHEREYRWRTSDVMTVEIPLIIPLKDLPAFNSMDIFERPFGDITLKLMLGYRSLIIFNDVERGVQYEDSAWNINDFTITNLTCECWGYNVGNDASTLEGVWAALRSRYDTHERGRIYEARFTDFKNFDGNMISGRFNIEFPYSLEMVKYIHMVFPRETYHNNVFLNPNLKDVKLKLDGILFPREENIRTDSRLFYHLQINDYEFDDDVKYSYTMPPLNDAKTDIRSFAEMKDNMDPSNFIMTWPLAIGPFMAVHRYSDNININFTAEIIAFVPNVYGVDGTPDYNNELPSPQIWFTHDSCWRLNLKEGLQFMRNVCPSSDLYEGNGDDVFYMHA